MKPESIKLNFAILLCFLIILLSCGKSGNEEKVSSQVNNSEVKSENILESTSADSIQSLSNPSVIEEPYKAWKPDYRVVKIELPVKRFDSLQSKAIPINQKLPFGPEILIKHKFPEEWYSKMDEENEHEKIINKLDEFYQYKLIRAKTLDCPTFSKVVYLKYPFTWQGKVNDSIILTTDSCKYRLPDFGPYEAYYHYTYPSFPSKDYLDKSLEEREPILWDAGNLLLINPKTREAKLLNIYAGISSSFSFFCRYFYIKENGTILIYEFTGGEGYGEVANRYSITVNKNGEIKFTNF